jgi:hypothetical protein
VTILVRVTAPHFAAGLEISPDGLCARAAPILGWAQCRSIWSLVRYFERKGWSWEYVV